MSLTNRKPRSVDTTTIYRDIELFTQELERVADRCPKSISWQHTAERSLSLIEEALDLYCAAYITPNQTEEKRRLLTVAYSALQREYTLLQRLHQRSRNSRVRVLTDDQFGALSEKTYVLMSQLKGFLAKTCKSLDAE